ncbi:MAG: GTP 3',8-cyclase MoaA [Eubacterium sp.]|nr:GTP 3',8-cyclase MoaA [Eubacterium sp.]
MQDGYGRNIDYMRISITDRCNLRCRYCMPERIETVSMSEILTYEEIATVVEEAAEVGITRIKITGGEPLVRRDAARLIGMLKEIQGIEEVTLTTNGILLSEQMEELKQAGIGGINISLDTLDPKRYHQITGFDQLDRVKAGIEAALSAGIPVKINAVSLEKEDVVPLIELTKEHPLDVRFIELMPIGMGKGFPGIPHDELIPWIRERYGEQKAEAPRPASPDGITADDTRHGNGPAVYYRIPGYRGSIGFISAIHGKFCDSCNRIRLTSQGFLKSCLCYDIGVDVKEVLRNGLSGDKLRAGVRECLETCILSKPDAHSFLHKDQISEQHTMSAIGG